MKTNPTFVFILFLLICVIKVSTVNAQGNTLTAQVDRARLSIDETFRLTLRFNGQTNRQPDFRLLEENFTIYSQDRNWRSTLINGRAESTTEWLLVLAPKNEGKQFIPSFKIDSVFSDAIEIEVTPPAPTPSGVLQDLFIETIVDKSSAYVQEQIKVTYRLYFSVSVESLDVDPFNLQDVIIEALPETIYQRNVSGKEYRVAEYSYAFFPQTSEQLRIPRLEWRVGVQIAGNRRDMFGRLLTRTELKRLRSDEKTLVIKPKPDSFPAGAEWLPASKLEISETWSSDTFRLGEPVTRNLTTLADGLRVEQLPAFLKDDSSSSGIKTYTDQAQSVDDKTNQGFTAKRVESAAIVISEPGLITIPGVRIPWWNVVEDKLMYAEVPPKQVRVEGSSQPGSSSGTTQIPSENETIESRISSEQIVALNEKLAVLESKIRVLYGSLFVCIALIVVLLLYLIRLRLARATVDGNKTNDMPIKNSNKQILRACNRNDGRETRKLLIQWAKQQWPSEKITTLEQIAELSNDVPLKAAILALDASLYGKENDSWVGENLAHALKTWKKVQTKKTERTSDLAELY